MTTPRLNLPILLAAQAQKHVSHNEALKALDILVQMRVKSRAVLSPPGGPEEGDCYLVPAGAGGDWSGRDASVVAFIDAVWTEFPPSAGWRIWVEDENRMIVHDGSAWASIIENETAPEKMLQNIEHLGINTLADSTNRLAVKSNAVLLSHAEAGDGDVRLVVNKDSDHDTASLLFQTSWQGQAEFGLTGDNDFHVKVSADGVTWNDAITVDRNTGAVSFPNSQIGASEGPVVVEMTNENYLQPAFEMRGKSRGGPSDPDEGVGLFLTYNTTGNRQFALADTLTGKGVRVIGTSLDAVTSFGSRHDLTLGTNSHGVHVGYSVSNTQFSVNNGDGTVSKTVFGAEGAAGQTGNLMAFRKERGFGSSGDALTLDAAGNLGTKGVENPTCGLHSGDGMRPGTFSVAAMPNASTIGAGTLIFVSDEAGGPVLAFSDGVDWRRTTDRAVVS